MTKSYLVEFKILGKMAYYSLQKIVLDKFPRNVNDMCMQKIIKVGHCAKFRDTDNFFLQVLFLFCAILCRIIFHFQCVARATFDRNLIHSADASFLVMA